jgi:hypothetical protein
MSQSSSGNAWELISRPALLFTESASEFEALSSMLVQEIEPHGIIEQMHVAEAAKIVWEMLRLHRCKAAMINTAFRAALKDLLVQLWDEPGEPRPYQESDALAFAWFSDPKAQEEVAAILGRFHLNETAIEAEAVKSLAAELEVLDRMLLTLEVRRDRALRGVAYYRESFAQRVREGSDKVVEAESYVRLSDDQVSG